MRQLIQVKNLILHHSLTKDSQTVSWDAIRRYHVEDKRWDDIGYHFGIELINRRPEILVGRGFDIKGAHCRAGFMNHKSLGIIIIGNYDINPVPKDSWDLAVGLCFRLIRLIGLSPSEILGHREAGLLDGRDWRKDEFKSCPGKMFDMGSFRFDVKQRGDWREPVWR